MRIRFYGARSSDGLPDETNMVFEESFGDLGRTLTGQEVFVQGNPNEYRFVANLHTELVLSANQIYWLEIVQVGDPTSHFRWETGFGAQPGHAVVTYATGDWRPSSGSFAFQLSTIPEPAAVTFFIFTFSLFSARRAPRRMLGGLNKNEISIARSRQ